MGQNQARAGERDLGGRKAVGVEDKSKKKGRKGKGEEGRGW